jgi:hypothetical protein
MNEMFDYMLCYSRLGVVECAVTSPAPKFTHGEPLIVIETAAWRQRQSQQNPALAIQLHHGETVVHLGTLIGHHF